LIDGGVLDLLQPMLPLFFLLLLYVSDFATHLYPLVKAFDLLLLLFLE
jgi:hypothetical protein